VCHGARAVVPRGLLACFASHVALRVLATAVARDRCRVAAQLLLQNGALAPLLCAAKLTKSTPAARVAALRSLLVTVRASHALAEALAAQPDALAALLQARLPFRAVAAPSRSGEPFGRPLRLALETSYRPIRAERGGALGREYSAARGGRARRAGRRSRGFPLGGAPASGSAGAALRSLRGVGLLSSACARK
jgi:hypothetical protein